MKRRLLILLAAFLPCMTACATPEMNGPGMIVTFRNAMNGKALLFDSAISATGTAFPNPGSLSPQADPRRGGATEGAAPDGRALPEWVEFSWIETVYQARYSRDQLLAMPVKKARVQVRERVPQQVIVEVIESKRHRELGKTPEKKLWVYFIWYENGIRFRWELAKGCCTILQSGGDQI